MSAHVFSTHDLAVDHALAQLSGSFAFLLHITPVDAEEVKQQFLGGGLAEPVFTYRDLVDEPDVLEQQLADIDVTTVEDTTLGHLLRAKHRELGLHSWRCCGRVAPPTSSG